MVEGGDSGASIAGSLAVAMEDQVISAPTLLGKLRCPQPATIARKRRVTINPPPYGRRRSEGRGNFDPKSAPLHNACESSLTSTFVFRLYVCCDFQSLRAVYHLISKNNFENYQKFSGNNWKYFWKILERIIGSSRGIMPLAPTYTN